MFETTNQSLFMVIFDTGHVLGLLVGSGFRHTLGRQGPIEVTNGFFRYNHSCKHPINRIVTPLIHLYMDYRGINGIITPIIDHTMVVQVLYPLKVELSAHLSDWCPHPWHSKCKS
jgi:hypothetical protein